VTLNQKLSKLWRDYETSWGFAVPPDVRQYYEGRYSNPDTIIEDLRLDLGAMSQMVKLAYSKGARLKKEAPQRKGAYMGPFMKRVNLAKKVTKAFIDLRQDLDKRKHWVPVADKINAENPSEQQVTPDSLRKDYQHAMSDTAVAGTVFAFFRQQLKGLPSFDKGTEVDFSANYKTKGGKSK
jgi:hypothetical protein